MEFTTEFADTSNHVQALFRDTFTTSEGPEAGRVIEQLVLDMLETVTAKDMYVVSAVEGDSLRGCIIFTRMVFEEEDRTVFIMAPVAIAPDHQGKGLGQRLIRFGLQTLRDAGVDAVLTYGDINFYSKTGFAQITEADARPPQPLSYPHGWLGQSLNSARFDPLRGASRCAPPLAAPEHW